MRMIKKRKKKRKKRLKNKQLKREQRMTNQKRNTREIEKRGRTKSDFDYRLGTSIIGLQLTFFHS